MDAYIEKRYGSASPDQFIRLYWPAESAKATFCIIHGGFWKDLYGIDNCGVESLVPFLVSKGYAVCLLEYRRVGGMGGWPETNEDILAGLSKLAEETVLRTHMPPIVLLGHSAGGTLALWSCCRLNERCLPFRPALCVAVAPIGDLEMGQLRRLSDNGDAIELYIRGTSKSDIEAYAERDAAAYKLASPSHLLPIEVPCILAVGNLDNCVPVDLVDEFYDKALHAARTRNGVIEEGELFEIELILLEGADHFQVMNANHVAWLRIFERIEATLQRL